MIHIIVHRQSSKKYIIIIKKHVLVLCRKHLSLSKRIGVNHWNNTRYFFDNGSLLWFKHFINAKHKTISIGRLLLRIDVLLTRTLLCQDVILTEMLCHCNVAFRQNFRPNCNVLIYHIDVAFQRIYEVSTCDQHSTS